MNNSRRQFLSSISLLAAGMALPISAFSFSTKNEKLKIEKKQLESDPSYIEKTAREKYSMKKEGEQVFKVQQKK